MKKSELEIAFDDNFKVSLEFHGFKYRTQVVLHGEKFRYDVQLTKGDFRVLIEIDGNGMGHSSVKAKERDARKGNHAVKAGFLFFRLTTKHFRKVQGVRIPDTYPHELIAWIIEKGA